MTIDDLIQRIDNEQPKETPVEKTEASVVETPPEADKEEDMLPMGEQFREYCESKKRK